MSRISAALGKTFPEASPHTSAHNSAHTSKDSRGVDAGARAGEYKELIEGLFRESAAVAMVGSGCGESAVDVCEGIAAELAGVGKRVVLVSVQRLLQTGPVTLSEETVFMPGATHNVWRWPSFFGQRIESFKPRGAAGAESWLDALRRNFDAVLLDCPALETPPGVAAVAAMADAAVLVVEAARTTKHQMLRDQRALQSGGVRLAGCILIAAR
jgi:hypothetical protein